MKKFGYPVYETCELVYTNYYFVKRSCCFVHPVSYYVKRLCYYVEHVCCFFHIVSYYVKGKVIMLKRWVILSAKHVNLSIQLVIMQMVVLFCIHNILLCQKTKLLC